MPLKEKEINKMYYTMGEVTTMFNVNASQIRYYEKEFDVLQPKKNRKGNRLFTPQDIEYLKVIFNLIDEQGFTLKGAKDYLSKNDSDIKQKQKLIESLTDLKEFLLGLTKEL